VWFVAIFIFEYFPATKHIIPADIMRGRKIKSELRILKKKIEVGFFGLRPAAGKHFFSRLSYKNLRNIFCVFAFVSAGVSGTGDRQSFGFCGERAFAPPHPALLSFPERHGLLQFAQLIDGLRHQ
jgi:hypothetical protein